MNHIPTTQEQLLFNWVNLHYSCTLEQLTQESTLVTLIQTLFQHVQSTELLGCLNEINQQIPVNNIISDTRDALAIIQSQYHAYSIIHTILVNESFSFTSFSIQRPRQLADVRDVLYMWSNNVLIDYISASIIQPFEDLSLLKWKNGIYLLSLLHYHNPLLVPNLTSFITSQDQYIALSTAFQLAYEHYQIPILLNPSLLLSSESDDESFIVSYLFEFILHLTKPSKDAIIKRHLDIERFKNDHVEATIQGGNRNTTTFTYSMQQLKITKTTKYSSQMPPDLNEFEERVVNLTEKLNALQHRLILIVPTRNSSNYSNPSMESSIDFFLTDDNSSKQNDNSTSSMISNEDHHQLILQQQQQQQLVKLLHPLQAAEEDYSAYDRNFKALQSEFQALTDGDLYLLVDYVNTLDSNWQNDDRVTMRKNQVFQLHTALANELERSETTLEHFRRGFAFARMCSSIRQELDLVQNKMVKSITTHHDIQELELHMDKTSHMVDTLKTHFSDLLLLPSTEESDVEVTMVLASNDTSYLTKFESISSKNELVKSWVEEVRVWFAEAERIRQWIEIRIEQLEGTDLPDPLTLVEVPASREQVEQLNAHHAILEKEIEAFDKEDMDRLRSHVKTLTGSGRADKDLSPADTTTIEITLTTLTTREKLINSLRKKSYDLQVLTQRVLWEENHQLAMQWLQQTDVEVNQFLDNSARWSSAEEDQDTGDPRERLMQKERRKEIVVQQLLSLEKKMAEFDQGQYTKTIDSFQDLDSTSSTELPRHLESRQDACEDLFDDLTNRMTFARNVVEQRLNVMDFLYQTEMVQEDAAVLQQEMQAMKHVLPKSENDREYTARVQNMHERIVQLVTVAAGRIPYPSKGDDEEANQDIQQVITAKRNQLILLSQDLDEHVTAFRHVLQLHRRCKEHLDDAARLCDWADERIHHLRKAKLNLKDGTTTAQDLQRLERDRDNILSKLKNGKENQVVDLLTRIQLLLETGHKLNITSLNNEALTDVSQQLEEVFDRLQQTLEDHGLDLDDLRKKMEDGNTYFENAKSLRAFMNETRHAMPALKQSCGFMTGQSEEQDKHRFDMLNKSLETMTSDYKAQQFYYTQLCDRFALMEPSKIENMQEIRQLQSELEQDWLHLRDELKDLDSFANKVGEWYDRQRRLSMLDLSNLQQDILLLAKSTWTDADLQPLQQRTEQAAATLKEIGQGIHDADNKDDPLQTANYSCARDRLATLSNQLQSATNSLDALKSNANKAVAYSAFLIEAEQLLNQVQHQKEIVSNRIAAVGVSGIASQNMQSMDVMFQSSQASTLQCEKESVLLAKKLESLILTAKQLESEPASHEPIRRVKDTLNQLSSTLLLEKKQAMFIRKMFIHAKAANDLTTWIEHCAGAIAQLQTDVCMNDEQELLLELDNLEQKIVEMRPTMQAFEAIPAKIFHQVDLSEISFNSDEIHASVKERESRVLKAWQELRKQHQQARQSVDQSKRGVEIARKVKSILTQVGDMKDRVSAVRICRNTHLDDGIENRDLKTVLSCPLTSIPSEHRLASAKAELTILDRDMEVHLQASIQSLDNMLSGTDLFAEQRAEITIALKGLMDLMKTKRCAIAEAEKMEGFLTVMEELEVLLLALTEVVKRADPSNARMVDGQYSRTDLQALLIDLDTRFRYYEPKINELFDESQEVAENLMDDQRVVDCLKQLGDKWSQLQQEFQTRKADLMERIGPLGDTFDALLATEGMLRARGQRAETLAKRASAPILKQPPSAPKTMQSTPRYMTGYNRTTKPSFNSTMANRTKTISPTARRVAARQMAASQQRQRVSLKTPGTYIADPKNDLDVALGVIVNDSPYKIQVKMVPGEVGKYWFGDVNPKLAYCRILRSRMVMVRVGGGWVELSQFLTDHALLEGGNFVSGRSKLLSPSPCGVRDGFLNTTVGRNSPAKTIRGGGGGTSPPTLKESRSTPYHRGISPTPFGPGIKTGNKFLAVDGDGNRVEVKMTKANSKDTKFTTPRRLNI